MRPVESRGGFVNAKIDLVREYLLVDSKNELVIDVLAKQLLELGLSPRVFVYSHLT